MPTEPGVTGYQKVPNESAGPVVAGPSKSKNVRTSMTGQAYDEMGRPAFSSVGSLPGPAMKSGPANMGASSTPGKQNNVGSGNTNKGP